MARLLERDPEVERLIAAFHADLVATGQFAESEVISPARAFLLRVGGASGWAQLPTEEQSRWLEGRESRVVLWMMVAGHAPARPELLVRGHQRIGKVAAWVHRDFHPRFMQVADDIGFDGKSAELQWWAVAKVAAVAGVPPDTLSRAKFETARDQLIDAMLPRGPAFRASHAEYQAVRGGSDALSRRGDRRSAAQAQGEPGRAARAAVGERPRQAGGDATGLCGADASHAAPVVGAARGGHAARVRAVGQRPGARRASSPRSSPLTYRALQAAPRRAPQPARAEVLEADDRGRAWHAADLPGAARRVGRRGRAGADADVSWRCAQAR